MKSCSHQFCGCFSGLMNNIHLCLYQTEENPRLLQSAGFKQSFQKFGNHLYQLFFTAPILYLGLFLRRENFMWILSRKLKTQRTHNSILVSKKAAASRDPKSHNSTTDFIQREDLKHEQKLILLLH